MVKSKLNSKMTELNNYLFSHFILKSGLGYIVGSGVAQAAGDWRWGVRTTPFLAYIALVVLVLFLTDPPRGNLILRSYHFARTNYGISSKQNEP